MPRIRHNKKQILDLHDKGLSNKEIAEALKITPKTVWDNLKLVDADNEKLAKFNKDLPSHLSKVIARLVAQLNQVDLSKTSPYQLAGMISLLIDKQRLITGQSTSNQALLFHMVEQACKVQPPEPEGEFIVK